MSRTRLSMASACLALFAASCGSGSGGGSGGNAENGGASGNGGSAGNASGGSTGNANGGSTGNANGGGAGNANGGSAGNASGGSAGNANGGSTGNAAGGSTGNPSGGAAGSNPGGSPGGTAGGAQAAGGSSSTGGTPMPSTVLVTSAANAYWKTDAKWTEVTSGNATVTVNDTTAQDWQGFGGAFNELGWSYLTTKDMQDKALQLLFGDDGCRFAWGRIPIGASDYATSRYTDDEVTSGSDTSMSSFSISRDKDKLIPYIKAAQAVKSDIKFWGSPWTPPTWMKTGSFIATNGSGKKTSSNFDSGDMKSDDATLKAYAQYLIKWVQAFKEQGIKVEIVSPQNEPNYLQNYPSCHWDTTVFVNFVGNFFGPAIKDANLDIKVMDGTLSNPGGDADIGQKVLQNATAKGYIGAIGVQWGVADSGPITTLKGLAGGIPIWISEHQCGGTMGSTAPAPNDFNYAKDSWGYISKAIRNGVTAYNAWNMVLDKGGMGIDDARKWPQNALLVADSGQVTATPAYYVFRHVSQYVDPGAKVVGTSGGDAVAFKNPDGSIVAAMYNSGGANANYIVSIAGKKLQFSMPGSGWATVKYK